MLCLRLLEKPCYDFVAPTSFEERRLLTAKFRHSRPGPSGWKLCFLEAFPDWVQEVFWFALDLQRLVGFVAPSLQLWNADVPYSALNRAFARGVSAAADVLYTDTLVCEDAARHRLPLLRVPADFEKFFNTLQLPLIDALQQGRSIPDSVRRLHQSLFSEAKVCLDTRVGLTTAISVSRGLPQGAVSLPELSRAAQDPMPARQRSGGFLLQRWPSYRAYASDWDSCLQHIQDPRLHAHGASVSSWNIWQGGVQEFLLPRSAEDHVDRLLGKRGTVLDRHSLAASDLLGKLEAARRRLSSKCCSWDEACAMMQWILGGTLNYAPFLVGLPAPSALHREDAALHRLIHASLGTRVTAEHVSLSAPRSLGGLALPLVSESL